jgi:murein DD-endopeptidase MepM/ murein hydrolase activator NlpD
MLPCGIPLGKLIMSDLRSSDVSRSLPAPNDLCANYCWQRYYKDGSGVLSASLATKQLISLLHRGFSPFLRSVFLLLTVLCLLFLSACRPPLPSATRPLSTPTTLPTSLPSIKPSTTISSVASAAQAITQTAVLAPGTGAGQAIYPTEAVASPAPDPLRFSFPTPVPAPASAWRPPLYPTPWALSPYDHFYFARPIAADEVNWPLWDYRYGGSFFENVIHTGVDIPAPRGTPVLAAGSGKVVWAGYGLNRGDDDPNDPYGLAVAIRHDFGYAGQTLYTVYGHLDRVDVVRGQYVSPGDALGLVGETGHTTGPHLHFEVRLRDNDYFTTRNPELWLVPPQGWGVLAGRVMDSGGQLKTGQEVIVHSLSSGQNWLAKTYASEAVNSDPYYQENVVIGDLPAGKYEVRIPYAGMGYVLEIEILPGVVNYFSFSGHTGMSTARPPTPEAGVLDQATATKPAH